MTDDPQPFFSSGQADSVSDEYQNLQSLDVEVQMTKVAGEDVGSRRYDENDLPSHVKCPECGADVSVGWTVADYIDQKATNFNDTVSCKGEIFDGKSCVVLFEIDGTASYV